jgi:hypothetical protein
MRKNDPPSDSIRKPADVRTAIEQVTTSESNPFAEFPALGALSCQFGREIEA